MELLKEVRHVPVVNEDSTQMNSEWVALLDDWAAVDQDAPWISRRTSGRGWKALTGTIHLREMRKRGAGRGDAERGDAEGPPTLERQYSGISGV